MTLDDIKKHVEEYKEQLEDDIENLKDLDEVYVKYFGKTKGIVTSLVKKIPEQRSRIKMKYLSVNS